VYKFVNATGLMAEAYTSRWCGIEAHLFWWLYCALLLQCSIC